MPLFIGPEACRTAWLDDEPVADPGFVEKHLGTARVAFQLAAQFEHERPQGLSIAQGVGPPEAVEDLRNRSHAARLARNNFENAQFGRGQGESSPVACDIAREQIDRQRAGAVIAPTTLCRETTQLGAVHFRQRILRPDRPREVVDAYFEDGDAVLLSIVVA